MPIQHDQVLPNLTKKIHRTRPSPDLAWDGRLFLIGPRECVVHRLVVVGQSDQPITGWAGRRVPLPDTGWCLLKWTDSSWSARWWQGVQPVVGIQDQQGVGSVRGQSEIDPPCVVGDPAGDREQP